MRQSGLFAFIVYLWNAVGEFMQKTTAHLPSADPEGDWAFFYAAAGEPWFAYEVPRDYLSQPRTFAILQLRIGAAGWFVFSDCLEQPSPSGLTWVSHPQWQLQWSQGYCQLDMCAETLQFVGLQYQLAGAAQALQDAIAEAGR